jgi:hypothetical protein
MEKGLPPVKKKLKRKKETRRGRSIYYMYAWKTGRELLKGMHWRIF